jgi:hypothetical protein
MEGLMKTSDFEKELLDRINEYFTRHQKYPKVISLSRYWRQEFFGMIKTDFAIDFSGSQVAIWKGIEIRFDKRRLSIECLPRFKNTKNQYEN